LLQSTYFPDGPKSETAASAFVQLSNENIIAFLEKSMEKAAELQDAKHRLQKCGWNMSLFNDIVESLKRDLGEFLGGIDVKAFIQEIESDIEKISSLAKDVHLSVKQTTNNWMMDLLSDLEEGDEGRRGLKMLLEKAMIKARDKLLDFKIRTKESPHR
jgi:DNA repair ATPase RecN